MSSFRLSMLAFGLFSLAPAFALAGNAKLLLYMGGSGDPPGDSTNFDSSARIVGRFAKEAGWEPTVLFDGKRPQSREAASRFGVKAQSFTRGNLEKVIANFRRKVAAKEIGPGDEFFLIVDSHGAVKDGTESSHSVAVEGGTVSLDLLRPLLQEMQQAGVRVAVSDQSCHSGYSLALSGPGICVTAKTAGELAAFGTMNFQENLKKGLSIEEAFLKARTEETNPNFSLISSATGKTVQSILRPLLRKAASDEEDVDFSLDAPCATVKNSSSFVEELLNKLETGGIPAGKAASLPEGAQGLDDLRERIRLLRRHVAEYDLEFLQEKARWAALQAAGKKLSPVRGDKKNLSYWELAMVKTKPEVMRAVRESCQRDFRRAGPSVKDRREAEDCLETLQRVEEFETPELQKIEDGLHEFTPELPGLFSGLWEKAAQIAKDERFLYEALYSIERANSREKGDACADFRL
jgi:hypothetical protein